MKKPLTVFLFLFLTVPAFPAVKKEVPKAKPTIKTVKIATPETKVVTPEVKIVTTEVKTITFKDLKPSYFAYPYVMKLVSYEVMSGYPDGTFRGKKAVTRAEFSKILTNAFGYLEKAYKIQLAEELSTREAKFKDLDKKNWAYPFVTDLVSRYKIITGYPDGTFKPKKTINRFELATVLAKSLRLVYEHLGLTLPLPTQEVVFADVKPSHWARKDIQLLLSLKIISGVKEKKKLLFNGTKPASRFEVAVSVAKMIDLVFREKPLPLPVAEVALPSRVEKALELPTKPQVSISGGWGNVYESGSGTNNWLGFHGSASYSDVFNIWTFSGYYEITGKYGFNQIVYLIPSGGGRVSGGVNNENRYEIEVNTIYPIVRFYGVSGKFLLGAKYINLSNPTAPTNFIGLNAGIVTSAKVFDRNFLVRAFYSLPLVRAQLSPSVLGQPSQLFDYDVSLDAEFFGYPVLFGYSGETMILSGGGQRFYNTLFARYYLF